MNKQLIPPIVLVLSMQLCALKGYGSDKLTIYTEQFPPYNFVEDQKYKGINLELVRMACNRANIRCEFQLLPWRRAMKMAKSNPNAGIVSISKTPERKPHFNWVGPLVSGSGCFFKLASRSDIQVPDRNSLLNYTVALELDDVYKELLESWGFEQGEHFVIFPEKQGDVLPFSQGRLDLIIGSAITIGAYLKDTPLQINDVEPVYRIMDPRLEGNHLGLNPNVPEEIKERLQNRIDALKTQNIHTELVNQYVFSDTSYSASETTKQKLFTMCL